jgi:DNA-binding NarL/FixJ family response regulator
MKKVKVALLEPNQVLLHGLTRILESSPEVELSTSSMSGLELIRALKAIQVDVILANINSIDIDALRLSRYVFSHYRNVRVILCGEINPGPLVKPILRHGVSTYFVTNSILPRNLVKLICEVHRIGFAYTDIVTKEVMESTWKVDDEFSFPEFNDREREVLCMICRGVSKKSIAEKLCLSPATIKYHLSRIFEKSQVSSTVELVVKALTLRWVEQLVGEKRYRESI